MCNKPIRTSGKEQKFCKSVMMGSSANFKSSYLTQNRPQDLYKMTRQHYPEKKEKKKEDLQLKNELIILLSTFLQILKK